MTFSGLGIVKLFEATCVKIRDLGVGVRALLEKERSLEDLGLEQSAHECCKRNDHAFARCVGKA